MSVSGTRSSVLAAQILPNLTIAPEPPWCSRSQSACSPSSERVIPQPTPRGLLLRFFANTNTGFPMVSPRSRLPREGGRTQDISLPPPQPWICQAGWKNLNSLSATVWASPDQVPKLLPQKGAPSTRCPGRTSPSFLLQLQACQAGY